MPEIGPTLRDARMRAKIDIADVELATKIRARYLRAIENEEWSILPGETFARSFIRTYAEFLGLDGKLLLEEFRRRHEHPSDLDLTPIAPPLGGAAAARRAPRGPRRPLGRGAVVVVALVSILGLLLVIGLLGGDDSNAPGPTSQSTEAARDARTARDRAARRAAAREREAARKRAAANSTRVALEVKPTAAVWVCLQDESEKKLIGGVVLEPGGEQQKFTSKSFTATFGNGSVDLVLNGKTIDVPASANPIGYRITPAGTKELGEEDRPTCG